MSSVIKLLYAHEHVPNISPDAPPPGIRWDASIESYVCERSDPNFERAYWKYQYQIGGFKLNGHDWLAQVGEGHTGERVFLHKRNGQVCFVQLKKMAFEDDEAQYFHIEFLRNEFDGEHLLSEEEESQHSTPELQAAIGLMQLRTKPFL